MNAEDAKKIISSAIDSEVEAYTYYTSVSGRATDPALKKLFGELASEEEETPGVPPSIPHEGYGRSQVLGNAPLQGRRRFANP